MITTASDLFLSASLALGVRGTDGEFDFLDKVSRTGEFSFCCGDPNRRGKPDI